ncbi:hypothetical protein EDC04DRAFT_2887318 [Pisolithus marmoratus]|nr:hypothetical protein EDC04DRAFT_2887318 [Pisolithus marmoratus]
MDLRLEMALIVGDIEHFPAQKLGYAGDSPGSVGILQAMLAILQVVLAILQAMLVILQVVLVTDY